MRDAGVSRQVFEVDERRSDHLVHIVVPIFGEPPDESNSSVRAREKGILPVQCAVIRTRYRIVRLAIARWKLTRNDRLRMRLTGEMLIFRGTNEGDVWGWVVDAADRLHPNGIDRFKVDPQRAVREAPKSPTIIFVDRTGVDEMVEANTIGNRCKVVTEDNFDVRVR